MKKKLLFFRNSTLRQNVLGFSLIEVLVSLSIFAVVMTIAVGSLMVLIAANSRSQNMQEAMTNISFALDSMTREIRTGTDYYCITSGTLPSAGAAVQDCSDGGALAFNEGGKSLTVNTSNDSRRIKYRLQGGTIQRSLGNGSYVPITSANINITDLRFYVSGSTRGDLESPTATIYISGTAGEDASELATFNIQTTVVQQLLDI